MLIFKKCHQLIRLSDIPVSFFQTEELVKALQDLENAASGDAAVRQKIASLPQEVQDVSLLEKITGKWTSFQKQTRLVFIQLNSV